MDLLEILSHQASLKRLQFPNLEYIRWQFPNLEYIPLPLTQTRLCSFLIEAAPKLRDVLNLSDACESILQGLKSYKESSQKWHPQLSITLGGN
jgi:hypothetical protein